MPLVIKLRTKILPLDHLIKLNAIKFMHSFTHNLLPISFHQMWISNRERNLDRVLRNADQLFVPPHQFATLKRMPMFNFPHIWNNEGIGKLSPIQHRYLKGIFQPFELGGMTRCIRSAVKIWKAGY
jgi:hypothetical protein